MNMPPSEYPKFSERELDVVPLHGGNNSDNVIKAGVLPFVRGRDGELEFYLYKPAPTQGHPDGPPKFQIAKGTRQMKRGNALVDMTHADLSMCPEQVYEPIKQTALREAREEIGLIQTNIRRLFDMGVRGARSATTNDPKSMYIFAAEVKSKAPYWRRPENKSNVLQWIKSDELNEDTVRADHLAIIRTIEAQVKPLLASEMGGPGI